MVSLSKPSIPYQPAATEASALGSTPFSSANAGVTSASMANPMHSSTESTLAPTAEFTRIFLLAWIMRYVFRGGAGLAFAEKITPTLKADAKGFSVIGNGFEKARAATLNLAGFGGRWLQKTFFKNIPHAELEAATYSTSMGVGSGALTLQYSQMVRNDITNLFSEVVGYELGKPTEQVTFEDITKSTNEIVRITIKNYHEKTFQRGATDALFLAAAPLRSNEMTDLLLGFKGVQIFSETWKRKPTMFEDLVSFVNVKINPQNGLGQKITEGEIFDLYQHFNFHTGTGKDFKNVIERDANESRAWGKSQRIFSRIAELMNDSYAYKHTTQYDAQGEPLKLANFPLPKFVYLLGQHLIDPTKPEQTLAYIEVANAHGMQAVREMQTMLGEGVGLEAVMARFPLPSHATIASPETPTVKITAGNTSHEKLAQELAPSRVTASAV